MFYLIVGLMSLFCNKLSNFIEYNDIIGQAVKEEMKYGWLTIK